MNYFELFEIPVQLKVEASALTSKYLELSKKYHPDYFINKPADEQAEALEKSAMLNEAYRTLRSQDETIRYVLMQKGLMEEEEKYDLPTDFLMEVLDINEQLMDADDVATNERMRSSLKRLQKEIYEPVKEIVEGYKEGTTSEKELLQLKEYYYQKKYLDRIHRQLAGKA